MENEISEHLEHCADCSLVLEAATHTLDRYFGSTQGEDSKAATRAA